MPEKTPYDEYTIHEFACQANIGAGNYAEAAKECEAELDDQFMPEADKPQMIKAAARPSTTSSRTTTRRSSSASAPSRAASPTEENKNFVGRPTT